ncbi:hypothetical protein BAOM_3113 [Peribacillus asahii]|uniref:Uncharacterized protein n=1 Tax=Peribacillus asahii TaxID=228899 RepID=A0A3Q9RNN9_9BACI|nr:hypothetical protein [Peribacillus asahii]AZV43722.1 hypothetical protein BAOM_3113 [Peribacillus asahii]
MTTYKIPRNSQLFDSYLEVSKGRVYKILPLLEEENEGLYHYVDSLLFEIYGLQYVITGVKESFNYLSLLCGLESILDEVLVKEKDLKFIRSEIFRLIGLIEKIQKGE